MKRLLACFCAAAMLISLTACGARSESSDETTQAATGLTAYADSTVTGKITALDGAVVTLQLGTLAERPDGENGGTPPEKPDGDSNETPPAKPDGENGGTPPEKPDGDSNETPPAKPDGDSGETPPAKPEGENGGTPPEAFTAGDESITVDLTNASITRDDTSIAAVELSEGEILTITFDAEGFAATVAVVSADAMPGGAPGGAPNDGTVDQGSSANTLTEDAALSGVSYSSTGDDENALRIDGAAVSFDGLTVSKSAGASSSPENGDFYGVNAAVLATNGAQVATQNAEITSSAQNGNGVFSYGSGTTVTISDSKITTTADNSGGIQTTGGGTTNASNLTVSTAGNSSAAIRSDRGGGTVNVDGGSYESSGYNSPAVYSTASITVKNAELTAHNSEALVIEGKNSITLENCTVSGNMSSTKGTSSDENVHNVMIYQSMSGDADVGTSAFSMTGGSLTGNNGDLFYVTNTDCTILLSGVSLQNVNGYLMNICGNSGTRGWGTAGQNGAQVEFTADAQTLAGDIVVDTISQLTLLLQNDSVFTGTINIVENAAGGTAVSENAAVTIEEGCVWELTGNCTLSTLTNRGTIRFNGYTITLADGSVLSE